jgi:hypothetical protein
MKLVAHVAVWILAFCAVLVSPVILIYGVPLAIGIGTEIVQAGAGPIAAVLIVGTASLMLCKAPVRASAKAIVRSAAPLGAAKRLAHGVVSRHPAKSIS